MAGCVITGAAWEWSAASWPDPNAQGQDPDLAFAAVTDAVSWALGLARRAWESAGLTASQAEGAGCVLGTLYGNDYVSEYVNGVLSQRGPRWLNPEAFAFVAPHATTAALCIELGLGGTAYTLVAPTGGLLAVGQGARLIQLGRHEVVLCGGFDWPSPLAETVYRTIGVPFESGRRTAALLILESEAHAAARAAPRLGRLLGWGASQAPPDSDHGSEDLRRALARALTGRGLSQWRQCPLLDLRATWNPRLCARVESAVQELIPAVRWVASDQVDSSPVTGPVIALGSALRASPSTPGEATLALALAPDSPWIAVAFEAGRSRGEG